MEVMGTSQTGSCGHKSWNISCETCAVQAAHGVAVGGGVQGQHGHGEALVAV